MKTTPEGAILACPACGKKNRVRFERLGEEARCGACGGALPAPGEPLEVEDEGVFRALLAAARRPVVVDFWAPWCGPCRAVAPEIAKVAARNAGKFLVVKVNTEAAPRAGAAHGVRAIPTMAVFAGGRELARAAGARPAAAIESFVRDALGRAA